MIWLTWRQFRAHSIVTAALLAALAALLLVTGLNLAHLYSASGLSACHGGPSCQGAAASFLNQVGAGLDERVYYLGIGLVYLAPALMGMFWGAPLIAREIETGTFRLAWNQSVSRARWLAVKLGLIGLAAIAVAGLLALMTNVWASPIHHAAGIAHGQMFRNSFAIYQLTPSLFGAEGIVPLGYAAFAFTLGVTAGLLIRRTIPAMAVTLAGFALVQIAWPTWVRPYLISPLHQTKAFNVGHIDEVMISNNSQMIVQARFDQPGAWVLSNAAVRPDGQPFTGPPTHACLDQGMQACNASIARLHLRQVVSYQPASRFWQFQWYETAIFLALAVALAGFCAWRVSRRRLS